VKGANRRYTYLRLRDDQVLEVVSPNPKSLDVEAVIRERQSWIIRQLDKVTKNPRVMTRESVMFDGVQLRIKFEKTSGEEWLSPSQEKAQVTIGASDRSSIRELVRRWFLKESSSYVVRELPLLARRMGVSYRRAEVREIKNWGYCTRDGRLSFSWQLIALPARLREYVLCHELVHLSVHDHGKAFKRKLVSVLPDFRERERDLNSTIPL